LFIQIGLYWDRLKLVFHAATSFWSHSEVNIFMFLDDKV